MSSTRGIYILGNDHVADYLEALFASLRLHSPNLPARLIPYNDRLTRTRELCKRFRIDLHEDPTFPELEQLGLGLWASSPYSSHQNLFHRLSIFWGPFDNFLYLDADIVILAPLEPLCDAFEKAPTQFASFDVDHERVYQAGPLRERMMRDHGSLGFNSGHFFSRRGTFTLEMFQTALRAAQPVAELFQDRGDQGFLNFAVDHLGIRQSRLKDFVPDLADKQWCEQPLRRADNAWRIDRPGDPEDGKKLYLIHWSGFSLPGGYLPHRELYYQARALALTPEELRSLRRRDFINHHTKPLAPFLNRLRIIGGKFKKLLRR